jgi:hypothetical protein
MRNRARRRGSNNNNLGPCHENQLALKKTGLIDSCKYILHQNYEGMGISKFDSKKLKVDSHDKKLRNFVY